MPALLHISMKWVVCCLGLHFPLTNKNLGGWYPVGIRRLSNFFVYSLEYVSESWEEQSYCVLIEAIMSWSCWTDKDTTETESVFDCSFSSEVNSWHTSFFRWRKPLLNSLSCLFLTCLWATLFACLSPQWSLSASRLLELFEPIVRQQKWLPLSSPAWNKMSWMTLSAAL